MTTVREAWELLRREALLEAAGRQASLALLPLVAALLVLSGLAFGPEPGVLRAVAPGVVWVSVLVAAVPLASVIAADERSEGTWDLLRGLVRPQALLLGKAAAGWCALVVVWALATVLAVALLGGPVSVPATLGGLLGTLGVATTTTTLGVLLGDDVRGRLLLAVLLLPTALPVLVAGAQAGSTGGSPEPWLALLAAYDVLALAAATVLFPILLEE